MNGTRTRTWSVGRWGTARRGPSGRLREALGAAIAGEPEPAKRIQVVAAAIAGHHEEFPALDMLARTEPGLVLARLGAKFDDLAALLQECLHPALAEAAPVRSGRVT